MNSFVRKKSLFEAPPSRTLDWCIIAAVVLASTVFPRLMLLGGFPSTDEGVNAYYALLIHQSVAAGHGLPDTGTLALYPMVLSWVFEIGLNPSILLRLVDLGVAACVSALVYQLVLRECSSKGCAALITVIFMFTLNQHLFIQYGFKNSIFAALVPLLLAVRIGRDASANANVTWLGVGALIAISVLLRETFAPFAAFGLFTASIAKGRRAALHFSLGGVVSGILVIGVVLVLRGGASELVQSYGDAGKLYSSMESQRMSLLLSNGKAAIQEASVALLCSLAAALVVIPLAIQGQGQKILKGLVFWLLLASIPLIEPLLKIGFPYHFSVALVGLAGFCAFALGHSIREWPSTKWAAGLAGVIAIAALSGKLPFLLQSWPSSREAVVAARSGHWPESAEQQSNYLLAAKAIRDAMPPGGTVSVSGFMFALYPLTGHLPPSPELANLSAAIIKMDLSAQRLEAALLKCPPDVVMSTTRADWPGANEIVSAIEATGIYEKVAEISSSLNRSYGNFAGTIYRSKLEKHPCSS